MKNNRIEIKEVLSRSEDLGKWRVVSESAPVYSRKGDMLFESSSLAHNKVMGGRLVSLRVLWNGLDKIISMVECPRRKYYANVVDFAEITSSATGEEVATKKCCIIPVLIAAVIGGALCFGINHFTKCCKRKWLPPVIGAIVIGGLTMIVLYNKKSAVVEKPKEEEAGNYFPTGSSTKVDENPLLARATDLDLLNR